MLKMFARRIAGMLLPGMLLIAFGNLSYGQSSPCNCEKQVGSDTTPAVPTITESVKCTYRNGDKECVGTGFLIEGKTYEFTAVAEDNDKKISDCEGDEDLPGMPMVKWEVRQAGKTTVIASGMGELFMWTAAQVPGVTKPGGDPNNPADLVDCAINGDFDVKATPVDMGVDDEECDGTVVDDDGAPETVTVKVWEGDWTWHHIIPQGHPDLSALISNANNGIPNVANRLNVDDASNGLLLPQKFHQTNAKVCGGLHTTGPNDDLVTIQQVIATWAAAWAGKNPGPTIAQIKAAIDAFLSDNPGGAPMPPGMSPLTNNSWSPRQWPNGRFGDIKSKGCSASGATAANGYSVVYGNPACPNGASYIQRQLHNAGRDPSPAQYWDDISCKAAHALEVCYGASCE